MAYQALYRKWRPSVFEDVVGQNHIVGTLKNQINTNKIAHAYLFCGSRGTGKTSTAKIFSRAVNCQNPVNGNPCNECETCRGIINSSIFDVVEIDGASNNKVDDIRNIRDEVVYPPADCKYKVYIIDEVHMLTTEAFNALLKTLEEPPAYVIFILATTEFHKIPATIISRCQKFDFKRITYRDTADRIKKVAENDNIQVTDSAVKLLAKAADGSLRDGLSKLDQCLALGLDKIDYKDVANIIGASDPQFLSDFCDAIIDENLGQALKLLDDGISMGIDALRLYSDVTDYFRDLLMIKTSKDYSLIVNSEEEVIKKYEEQANKITLSRILKIIETLFDGQSIAKYLTSPKLSFETSLLKIASKNTDTDIERLLERINVLEEKLEKISKGEHMPSPVKQKDESLDTEAFNIETEQVEEDEEYTFDTEDEEGSFKDEEFVFPQEYMSVAITEPKKTENEENLIISNEGEFGNSSLSEEPEFIIPANEVSKDSTEQEETFLNEFFSDDTDSYREVIPAISDEEVDLFNAEKENNNDEVIDIEAEEENNEELENIALNFKEFTSQMKNKDMGFDTIIKSGSLSVKGNVLSIEFDNKTSYDIAKANKYNELIIASAKEQRGIDILVKLIFENTEKEIKTDLKDPLDDVIEIAEQNQIIFNFEE